MGFSAFTVPAGSTSISVQVIYYDFKNGSQTAANGALIRCNDTTNRLSATHNPGNGNGAIALRTLNYATNPKSGAAWTVDEVNGVGTNGLTAFGFSVTDASPSSTFSSAVLQVTYTEASSDGTLAATLGAVTLLGTGVIAIGGSLATTLGVLALSGTATVAVGGSATPTLGVLGATGTGSVPVAGILTPSLSAVTLSGTGDSGAPAVVVSAPVGSSSWSRPVRSRTFRGRR